MAKINTYARDAARARAAVVSGASVGGRGARVVGCRDCGAPVFRGHDADLMAFEVSADVMPLTAADELAALLAERRTYELRWEYRGRYVLERRDRWRIRDRPPGTPGLDVLAAHACWAPLGTVRLTTGPAVGAEQLPDEPPF